MNKDVFLKKKIVVAGNFGWLHGTTVLDRYTNIPLLRKLDSADNFLTDCTVGGKCPVACTITLWIKSRDGEYR